jgi:hypothetical protein
VVGWLIQNERIPLIHEQLGKRNTFLLTARKFVCLRIKQTRHAQLVEHGFTTPVLANCITHGSSGKHGLLSKNANSRTAPTVHHTIIWGVLTTQNTKQSAFSAAVEAHNANSVAFGKGEGYVRE